MVSTKKYLSYSGILLQLVPYLLSYGNKETYIVSCQGLLQLGDNVRGSNSNSQIKQRKAF